MAAQDDGPQQISWQSAGDSYSSGEGVYGNKGDCAQSQNAYGPKAAKAMAEQQSWGIDNETFTACTGHLIEDFFHPRDEGGNSLWQWGREQGGPERVDVLTMSFGGNDVGFADVLKDCVVLPDSWFDALTGTSGCDTSETDLEKRIDALADPPKRDGCSTRRRLDGDFMCVLALEKRSGSIVDFYYDLVTNQLTDRGRLYVVGYPRVFADTDQWPWWGVSMCSGVKRGDTEKLGRLAERLNNKLQEAVGRANKALGSERVVFVDRFASFRDGQHELCGRGDDWLNGLGSDRGVPLEYRWENSFHPNAAGHAATATQLVERAAATFPSGAPTWDEIKNASIPSECGHPPTKLVNGENVSIPDGEGMFELRPELSNGRPGILRGVPSNDAGPLTAVVASCNVGGVGIPSPVLFFSAGGVYYATTFLGDEEDYAAQDLLSVARDGVTSMTVHGGYLEVDTEAVREWDALCCPTGAAIVTLRLADHQAIIVSIEEDLRV